MIALVFNLLLLSGFLFAGIYYGSAAGWFFAGLIFSGTLVIVGKWIEKLTVKMRLKKIAKMKKQDIEKALEIENRK